MVVVVEAVEVAIPPVMLPHLPQIFPRAKKEEAGEEGLGKRQE